MPLKTYADKREMASVKDKKNGRSAKMGGGMMMIGMGLVWLLVIVTLLLAIAALIKYLRK